MYYNDYTLEELHCHLTREQLDEIFILNDMDDDTLELTTPDHPLD